MSIRLPRRVGLGAWSILLIALATPSGFGQVRQVPLGSAYGTTGQKNLKKVDHGFIRTPGGHKKYNEPYGAYLQQIYSEFRSGASNVFLVRASDIAGVIRGTSDVLVRGEPADTPVRAVADPKQTVALWFVAYLGVAGSGPPQWAVRSVEWRGTTLRLNYVTGEARTRDMHQYFVWVPLGDLKPGTYTLELFDARENKATLVRRVMVGRE